MTFSQRRMASERPPLSSPHCAPRGASSGLARKRGSAASVAVRNHGFGKRVDILSFSASRPAPCRSSILKAFALKSDPHVLQAPKRCHVVEGGLMQVPRPRGSHTRSPRGQVAPSSCRVVHMSLGSRDAGTRKLLRRGGSSENSRLSRSSGQRLARVRPDDSCPGSIRGVPTGGSLTQRGHGPGLGTTLIGAELSDKRPRFYFLV